MESGVGTLSASEKPPEAEEGMECCLDKVDKGLEAGHPQKLVDYIQLCIYTYIYIQVCIYFCSHNVYSIYTNITYIILHIHILNCWT
jgi:hypothetical protein